MCKHPGELQGRSLRGELLIMTLMRQFHSLSSQTTIPHPEAVLKINRGLSVRICAGFCKFAQDRKRCFDRNVTFYVSHPHWSKYRAEQVTNNSWKTPLTCQATLYPDSLVNIVDCIYGIRRVVHKIGINMFRKILLIQNYWRLLEGGEMYFICR